ncbi:BON domain-containing protein [Ottowia sp.]|uniref:BON domain-containing protein n=1 Tax=Ottowia sp. TaxID=1898956 RepID=UPI0026335776|nr:BON domain-containing protein [Ottowia sp.]
MHPRQPYRSAPARSALLALGLAGALAGCSGGTPWGATPQNLPVPDIRLPDLERAGQEFEGTSGSTAGAQRVADRVRQALAADPRLAGAAIGAQGFEGGLVVLSGTPRSAAERNIAVDIARRVPGVREVVDRMAQP